MKNSNIEDMTNEKRGKYNIMMNNGVVQYSIY
jgi:hypothetical protein